MEAGGAVEEEEEELELELVEPMVDEESGVAIRRPSVWQKCWKKKRRKNKGKDRTTVSLYCSDTIKADRIGISSLLVYMSIKVHTR